MLQHCIRCVCVFLTGSVWVPLTLASQIRYRRWCDSNNFDLMLPEDAKKRKRIVEKNRQSSVTEHFGPEDPPARPTPYSDKALQTAAIEWLIETNQVCTLFLSLSHANTMRGTLQPIQTFNNAAFKNMIDIASQANRSIRLLSSKQSRARIIKMFKQQLCSLRDRLNVLFFILFTSFVFAFTDTLLCLLIRAPP